MTREQSKELRLGCVFTKLQYHTKTIIRRRKIEKRKEAKKEIRKVMKELEEKELSEKLTDLENFKNDSNKYFAVMRQLQRTEKKKNLLIKDKNENIAGTTEEQIEIITQYFKEMLSPILEEEAKTYPPSKMRTPFKKEEIQQVVKTLKNGKSPGIDKITAEYIKYSPDTIHEVIADIFNEIAEKGNDVEELIIGILNPLQKPNKKQGPPAHLRPIILLSILRKILTICVMNRIWNRLSTNISAEQAAYQGGRSTTEQVFAIKQLIDKTLNSKNYEIYLLLLDMSKAFDTVNRNILFSRLETILENDELHLLYILTMNPKLKVRVDETYGETFLTTLGIMQGDCLSAILFIFYLGCCLATENEEIDKSILLIKPKYADDITYASTNQQIISQLEENIPKLLKEYNLQINTDKTEKFTIPKPPPPRIFFPSTNSDQLQRPRTNVSGLGPT